MESWFRYCRYLKIDDVRSQIQEGFHRLEAGLSTKQGFPLAMLRSISAGLNLTKE